MRIQHNIMAMNAYRNYTNNVSAMKSNLEKLSSGYKINRAGDDAAGLAISEKMRAQITGLQTAQKNAKDGISLVQTAEGALTEVHDMLNRMVELATQSANGTYDNDTDRDQLQKEVNQLRDEINRIADSSNFNGIKLLDGTMASGTTAGASGTFNIPDVGKTLGVDTILHKNSTDARNVSFGVDLGDAEFTVADGAEMTVTIGTTAIKITAGSTATDESLTAGDIAAIIAGTSTKTGYTVTVGTGTASITDGKFTIGGEEFQATKGTNGVIKFEATSADCKVDPKMKVELKGAEVDVTTTPKTDIATANATKLITGGTSGGTVTAAAAIKTSGAAGTKAVWEAAVSDLITAPATKAAADYKLEITIGTGENAITATANVSKDDKASAIMTALASALNGKILDGGSGSSKYAVAASGSKLVFTAAANGTHANTVNPTGGIAIKKTDVQEIDLNAAYASATGAGLGSDDKVKIDIGGKTIEVDVGASATAFADNVKTELAKTANKITGDDTGDYTVTASAGKLTLSSAKAATTTLSAKVYTEGTPTTEKQDSLSVTHYNVNTIIPDEGAAAEGGLASTVIKIDKSMTTNGSKITIGYKDYTFTTNAADKNAAASSGKVYIGDLDSNDKDYLVKVGERLAKAADTNDVWTVGKADKDGTITLAEKTKDDGTALGTATVGTNKVDLTTKEGIAATLGYTAAGRTGKGLTLQIGDTADDYNRLTVNIQDMHCASLEIDKISIADQDSATAAVDAIKKAINKVSDVRGTLGATQNRLDHTINNLSVMTENIQDAESTIRDVDVAEEMMAYTKNNILIQSAQAMLAQANQVPQGVLQLLG